MKFNTKILALLLVFIAVLSVSAVSAEDVVADDTTVLETSVEVEDTLATTYEIADGASASDIEAVIANTSAGDTLNFAENGTYDLGENDPIAISHTLILQGNGATIKGYQGFLFEADEESVAGSQVYNLNFEVYDPSILWNGRALDFEGGSDYIIENCTFKNGHSGVYVRRPSGNVTIQNNYFFADEGATNESTITGDFSKQETGAKAINLMGGTGIVIYNNIIEGDYLDAFSIASGASNVEMYGNNVTDVWYGVFYGGGITNISMAGNTFENSKAFALGIIKAQGNSDIHNNLFITPENKSTIYVQEGNTAHGAPSNIETILIYNNTFMGPESTAVSASSNGGMITPKGEFTVVENIYEEGITVFAFTDNNTYTFTTDNLVVEEKNVTIEGNDEILGTIIVGSDKVVPTKAKQRFEVTLKDSSNRLLANQTVKFTINGVTYERTTDENGIAGLNINLNMGDYDMTVSYTDALNHVYIENFTCTAVQSNTSIQSTPVTFEGKGNVFTAKLVDQLGQAIADAAVAFHINGVKYYRVTDSNGEFNLNINLNPGIYNMYMSFDGTGQYAACNGGSQVTVI